MQPEIVLTCILGYFALLLSIAWITGRKAGNNEFFIGNRKSRWYLVALGLVGDSLSGVTFISVPGAVYNSGFEYFQLVMGYFVGYFVIALVLLPLYYRLNLVSIYSYLKKRFGIFSQKTGSFFFLLSRLVGAAGRLCLASVVLQKVIFDPWNIPFEVSVLIMIGLMLLYTYKGGIKTLVWTDSLQSIMLVLGLLTAIWALWAGIGEDSSTIFSSIYNDYFSRTLNLDLKAPSYFWKHFIGGIFIAICMTGLDQNMMQKNLSCPRIQDAQKNLFWFSGTMVIVTGLFLCMGALLYIYADTWSIALERNAEGNIITDKTFPTLALGYLGPITALAFTIGLTAATFSSADSVLATLTTSFCIDFLRFEENAALTEIRKKKIRQAVHLGFSVLLYLVILGFQAFNDDAIINTILAVASYTYGPLLGLFAFGILLKRGVRDRWVPVVCVLAPVACWLLQYYGPGALNCYKFGYELLIINGLLTFAGLGLLSYRKNNVILQKNLE